MKKDEKKYPVKKKVVKPFVPPTKEELAKPHHPSRHGDGSTCLNCNADLKE